MCVYVCISDERRPTLRGGSDARAPAVIDFYFADSSLRVFLFGAGWIVAII